MASARVLLCVALGACCALADAEPGPVVAPRQPVPAIRLAPVRPDAIARCLQATVVMRPAPEAVEECVRGLRIAPVMPATELPVTPRYVDPPLRFEMHREYNQPLRLDLHQKHYQQPPALGPWLTPVRPGGSHFLQPRRGWPGFRLDITDTVQPGDPQ